MWDLQSSSLNAWKCTYRVEWLSWIDAEDYEYTLAITIVILSDGFIFILSCGVPDLKLDAYPIDFYYFIDIVNADSHHVVLYKFALGVPQQHIALAYSWVTYYYDLLQVVKLLYNFGFWFY